MTPTVASFQRPWASELGRQDAASPLDETLQEEIMTDRLLTTLATANTNKKGAQS